MTKTQQLDPSEMREMSPTEKTEGGIVSSSPFDIPRAIRWGPGPDTLAFSFEYSDDEADAQAVPLDTDMNPPVNVVHGKYSGKILMILVRTTPGTITPDIIHMLSRRLVARSEGFERVNQRLNYRLIALVFDNLADAQERKGKTPLDSPSKYPSTATEERMNPQFAALADQFEAQVKGANLTGTTEVTLIYRCVDQDGHELPPVRTSLAPLTTIKGFGGAGPAFAASLHRDTILGNINSLVRHAPEGLILLRDAPPIPRRIVGFELQISDAAS